MLLIFFANSANLAVYLVLCSTRLKTAAKILQILHIRKHSGIFFEKKAIYRDFARAKWLGARIQCGGMNIRNG